MVRTDLNLILLAILVIVIVSCKSRYNTKSVVYPYKIEKIDSLNNYYIIHISKDSIKYQVVSKKSKSNCDAIKVNQTYPSFIFEAMINENDYISKDKPANYLDFVPIELKLDDSTIIKRDIELNNIYKTNNLNGLCYVNLMPKLKIK